MQAAAWAYLAEILIKKKSSKPKTEFTIIESLVTAQASTFGSGDRGVGTNERA